MLRRSNSRFALLTQSSFVLLERSQQTRNRSQKGNPFDQGRSQDHVCANFTRGFGLTGDRFYGALTDLADTDTGTHRGKTRTDRSITRLKYIQESGHQRHATCFL
jgi:hypothetical protein